METEEWKSSFALYDTWRRMSISARRQTDQLHSHAPLPLSISISRLKKTQTHPTVYRKQSIRLTCSQSFPDRIAQSHKDICRMPTYKVAAAASYRSRRKRHAHTHTERPLNLEFQTHREQTTQADQSYARNSGIECPPESETECGELS